MENLVNDRTIIMMVGSAPAFPHGVIDPIADIGNLPERHGLWLHVDACVGGFSAPFARMAGDNIPDFDFVVPAVRSMSADLHKYGFTAKGASIVFIGTRKVFLSRVLSSTTGRAATTPPRH